MPLTDPIEDEEFDDINDSDYVFIVDTTGHLKSILLPEGFEDAVTPENVTKILQIFEVGTFHSGTIH